MARSSLYVRYRDQVSGTLGVKGLRWKEGCEEGAESSWGNEVPIHSIHGGRRIQA